MKYIFSMLFLFVFSGCSTKTIYPDQWEEIKSPKTTPVLLNGMYKCQGEYIAIGHPNVNKAYIPRFFGIGDSELQKCDTIYLEQFNLDTLKIVMKYKDIATQTKLLKLDIDYFYNSDKEIYFNGSDNGFVATNGVIVFASETDYFNYNKAENLVVREVGVIAGSFLFVIPLARYEKNWMLFRKANKD